MLYDKIGVTLVYNFALRKFDFRGQWPATPKKGGGSLAVGSYLQRGSALSLPRG